jgi:RNA polymerase sigma-70 factor (ECF subfamily)
MAATDPSLFVRLLLQHQNDLLRYILPLVGCLDDAQDVLQETATALWRKFDQYDPQQPFLPWARRFARNEVLMHHRKRRRYTFLTEELIDTLVERSAEHEGQEEWRRNALRNCVEKLPEADRLLLDRRYGEPGTTIQQLAAETGAPANVLYKALARIRRQLLDCVSRALAVAGAT